MVEHFVHQLLKKRKRNRQKENPDGGMDKCNKERKRLEQERKKKKQAERTPRWMDWIYG